MPASTCCRTTDAFAFASSLLFCLKKTFIFRHECLVIVHFAASEDRPVIHREVTTQRTDFLTLNFGGANFSKKSFSETLREETVFKELTESTLALLYFF